MRRGVPYHETALHHIILPDSICMTHLVRKATQMKTLRLVIFLLLLSAVALGNRAISSASEEGSDSAEQERPIRGAS